MTITSHTVADPQCYMHQDWPTKPDESARCWACRTCPSECAEANHPGKEHA